MFRVFNVKKSNGKDCLIIDRSTLNTQIPKSIFKMEDHEYFKNLIRPGVFMASIDLSNRLSSTFDLSSTFFSIPLNKDSKKVCSFEFKGILINMILTFSLLVLPLPLEYLPKL